MYESEFQGWDDWLVQQEWRPFEEARAYVRTLGFTSKVQWEIYAQSEEKPADIPVYPERVYAGFREYQDWFGMRCGWRPFENARLYAQGLGLTTIQQWREHCKTGAKPRDIPATPDCTYRSQFCGWKDWLGKQEWRSFEEARAYVRTLSLTSKAAWEAYAKSGEKPADIPVSPKAVYGSQFRGYQDWLGILHVWNRNAMLALLHDLRTSLPSLQEYELYAILDRSGALPGLRLALGANSTARVFRDLWENNGGELEARLSTSSNEAEVLLSREGEDYDLLGSTVSLSPQLETTSPLVITEEGLRALDTLTTLPCGIDDEIIEYMIATRVSALWERRIREGERVVEALLHESNGHVYFEEIKRRYLVERAAVEALPIPSGWAFTDDQGHLCMPNVMQRRIAWLVRERRRIGNWSGTGTGKTLSAILASRTIDAQLTLVIVANPTVDQWQEQILNAYPDSIVCRELEAIERGPGRHCYLLLNYEKFQRESRGPLIAALSCLRPDFIVFDELQFIKQRGKELSHRREALEGLMQAHPSCAVLGMSATPIINDLTEIRTLLEMIIGLPIPVDVRPTVSNALAMHRLLLFYGIRNHPACEQDVSIEVIKVRRNDLIENLLRGGNNLLKIEQILLAAKLEAIRPFIRKGLLVYTHYIEEIVEPIVEYIEAIGYKVGRFTGTEKAGLEKMKHGCIDVLVGSSAVSVGIDGIQKVCDRIIMLSLPWTHAAFEQIVGRARRQGSLFSQVEVIVPQILLAHETDTWSWDERRWEAIGYKRTLSDCVLEGIIPEATQLNPQEFLQQSYEALEQWIRRVTGEKT